MMKRPAHTRRRLHALRKHQGGWVQILYWLIATIITIALTPKPPSPKPAALEDLDLPTAEEDRDLPIIFGKFRITGLNLTWHGNFGTNKIKKSSLFSSSTIGYRYFLGMMMHLCRGPVDKFTKIEAGDKLAWSGTATANTTVQIQKENLFGGEKVEGGLYGAVDFTFGAMTQVCNEYLAGQVDPPHPGFRGVAGLVYRQGAGVGFLFKKFRAGGGGYIGTNGYVKPWAVTATRILAGWHNDVVWYPEAAEVDEGMNPIHAIYEALTNPLWGANQPTDLIDDTNFRYCADVCKAENAGITMMWAHSSKVEDFIQTMLDHVAAALGVSNGKYVITMIRGNYVAADLPLFNKDNMGAITECQRRSWGETVNELTVAYTDPVSGKNTDITVQDLGNIRAQKTRIPEKIDRTGYRNHDVIKVVAGRELLSRSTPLCKLTFTTNRTAFQLKRYDVFRCQRPEPEYGLLAETVFRVVDVRKGTLESGEITVGAVEDIYALDGIEYSITPPPPDDVPEVELPEDGPDNSGTVTSTTTSAPPSLTNLTDGQRFLIPAGATGDWAGHSGQIAEWDEDSEEWIFIDVPDGTVIGDQETGETVAVYQGETIPVGGSVSPLTTKGDLFTHNGSAAQRQPAGADNTYLMYDSTQPNGLRAIRAAPVGEGASASRAYKNATQAIANATLTALTWPIESYDSDSYHSTVTNTSRFTAPTAGKYAVGCSVKWDSDSAGHRGIYVVINGATATRRAGVYQAAAANLIQHVNDTLELAAGDYVEFYVEQDSGGSRDVVNTEHITSAYMSRVGVTAAPLQLRGATWTRSGAYIALPLRAVRLYLPVKGTIVGYVIDTDQVGSAVIDVRLCADADYPPEPADSIVGSNHPSVSGTRKVVNTTLAGWDTTAVPAGSWIEFAVQSVSNISDLSIQIFIRETQ